MTKLVLLTLSAISLSLPAAPAQDRTAPRVPTLARTLRHPRVAKVLRLQWVNTVVVEGAVTKKASTGVPERIATKGLLTRRHHGAKPQPMPTLIFVYDPSFTHRELGRLEADVFGEEAVLIGCLGYRLFKAPARAHLPAGFYVLDAGGRIAAHLALNTKRRDLLRAMAGVHDRFWVRPQKRFIAEVSTALVDLERAADRASVEGSMPAATALAEATKRCAAITTGKRRPATPPANPDR